MSLDRLSLVTQTTTILMVIPDMTKVAAYYNLHWKQFSSHCVGYSLVERVIYLVLEININLRINKTGTSNSPPLHV